MDTDQLYQDIQARTGGEIYIGVVGPVRTGKSTFIKRFMELLVLPQMEEEHGKQRARDELPQSASGRTVMTTEPKFVPKDAAKIRLSEDIAVSVRLIDCVGYMVEGASGHIEGGEERLVKTPWFDHEIPFTRAAGIGTRKVIHDHATIGIVITTDGSITDIPRSNYRPAEKQTIQELQSIGKPFVVLVNSKKPYGDEARQTARELQEEYHVTAIPVNCEQLKEEDIHKILEAVNEIKDAASLPLDTESPYISGIRLDHIEMNTGRVAVRIEIHESHYYEMLSEMTGIPITGQYELISAMKQLSESREEYEEIKDAFLSVKMKGYGVVSPRKEEIHLDDPQVIRQGNKYGVKIHSEAPSIHLIRANIETEIAPIVGNEQQAQDLIRYLGEAKDSEEGIWGTNIFGKSVEDLVMDGMRNKMAMINEASQEKLQDTMQKIVNDSNGGLVCIII